MTFDRFDICAAYYLLESDWNSGGWLPERPACQRRNEAVHVQTHRLGFRPSPMLDWATLTENAREIYIAAAVRFGLVASHASIDPECGCVDGEHLCGEGYTSNSDVWQAWAERVLPGVAHAYEADGIPDWPARRESFNNHTDALRKDGEITDHQYHNIEHPPECEE